MIPAKMTSEPPRICRITSRTRKTGFPASVTSPSLPPFCLDELTQNINIDLITTRRHQTFRENVFAFSRKSLRNATENFRIISRNVSFAGNPKINKTKVSSSDLLFILFSSKTMFSKLNYSIG